MAIRIFVMTLAILMACGELAEAGKGGGGSSSSSGGSSGGGRSSFSGGRSSFSNPPSSSKPPSSSGNSSASKSLSFSGGSSGKATSSSPIAGKTPTNTSTKPAASSFDSLAGKDAKKAESRTAYESSKAPAQTYKNPAGKEVKIDPKDKQIDNLRGRLDEQRWVNRTSRQDSFYGGYASRPVVIYNDCYHPMWNYWLLGQSLDTMSLWCYHHQSTMDQARINEMYAQNAGLRAKVAALESQKIVRDPTYMPAGVDPDLAYNDAYVDAVYNPNPKTITEYEYEGSNTVEILLWVFVYIPLILVGLSALYFFVFVHRW